MNTVVCGDSLAILKTLPNEVIDCCVTSPPYWALRDYGMPDQIGLEPTYYDYLERLLWIFDEVKRVLKKAGTCWINLGDTYGTSSSPGVRKGMQATNRGNQTNKKWQKSGKNGVHGMEKSLLQIPSRFAIEMCNRGWILRNKIIWHKPNVMPQSVRDRFTVDYEEIFFFTKRKKYFFKQQFEPANYDGRTEETMRASAKYQGKVTPGHAAHTYAARAHQRWQFHDGQRMRNKRCVWSIPTKPYKEAHFATYPSTLIEPMIKAGCPQGGIVLDPFMGSGTTAWVARNLGRNYLGCELNPAYIKLIKKRLMQDILL